MNTSTEPTKLARVSSLNCYHNPIYQHFILECTSAISGCQLCQQESLGLNQIVKCTVCQDGLYLLSNSTGASLTQQFNTASNPTLLYPDAFTFCVPDCKKAHYAYVNNQMSGKCTFCGENCASCNSRTGCEVCSIEDKMVGWVNASIG